MQRGVASLQCPNNDFAVKDFPSNVVISFDVYVASVTRPGI